MEGSDFTSQAYKTAYANYVSNVYSASGSLGFNVHLVDAGDQYVAMGLKTNYTYLDFQADAYAAHTAYPGFGIIGPGLTEDADPSWLLNF